MIEPMVNSTQRMAVRAGQVELAVTQAGQGLPLVLVHGFPLDHTMWRAQIAEFSQHFRVIAPDVSGFGGSPWPSDQAGGHVEQELSMELIADDLADLLEALQVREPVVFCGLSMGGYVAFQFWRKHGSQVRALVLSDTRSVADTPAAATARLAMARQVLETGTEGLADSMLPKLFAEATFRAQPSVVEATRQMVRRASRQGVAAALVGMAARPDVTDLLGSIHVPALVIVGRQDAIASPDEMKSLAAAIPGAEYVVIPEAGHMAPLENPAAFNQALASFLQCVEPANPMRPVI